VGQVLQALAFIDQNLSDRLTLSDIAASLSLSPCHFAHLFRRMTGLTPHQYVMQRRMGRARGLLAGTDLPIAHVALVVGCANQSHFSAMFRRVTGTTPLNYRRCRSTGRCA
jgi:AraC family transcriptional regulator